MLCRAAVALLMGITSAALGQEPGTVEVGFFGSQRESRPGNHKGAGALVTVFVSRHVAIETHQEVLSFGTRGAEGSVWAVAAQPFAKSRLHFGPGIRFSTSDGRPQLEASLLAGGRWTLYDWVGVRTDLHLTRVPSPEGGDGGTRYQMGVFGGFSVRIRG